MYKKAYTNGANCTIRVILRNFPRTYKILSFSRLSILVNVKLQQQLRTGHKDIRCSRDFLPRSWLDCDAVTRNFCAVLIAVLKFYYDFRFGHNWNLCIFALRFLLLKGLAGCGPFLFTRISSCIVLRLLHRAVIFFRQSHSQPEDLYPIWSFSSALRSW